MPTLLPQSEILGDLSTPCLIVDGEAMTRNIERMAAVARSAGIALRPHAKTHKSPEIAAMQLRAGAIGIACATIAELEALAAADIGGLLLTSPVMETEKCVRLARINRAHGVIGAIDHPNQLHRLQAAMEPGDRPLGVVIDVDVGQARTGVTDIAAGVQLARMIAGCPEFTFAGLQGFAGHAQHIVDPMERKAATEKAAAMLRSFVLELAQAGLPPAMVSGSGTGTHSADATGPYTELQVGSYVFMDADYARILDETGSGLSFEPSLFVLGTVVSINRPDQVTIDVGTKALASNGPPPKYIIGAANGSTYRFAGDEHGIVSIPYGQARPALGDRLLIGATHCDPTVNLHSCYHVIRNGQAAIWRIRARYGD